MKEKVVNANETVDGVVFDNIFYKRNFKFNEATKEYVAKTKTETSEVDGIHFNNKGFEYWNDELLVKTWYFTTEDDLVNFLVIEELTESIALETNISVRMSGETRVIFLLAVRPEIQEAEVKPDEDSKGDEIIEKVEKAKDMVNSVVDGVAAVKEATEGVSKSEEALAVAETILEDIPVIEGVTDEGSKGGAVIEKVEKVVEAVGWFAKIVAMFK